MTTLTFPTNPAVGDVYAEFGVTYVYTGSAWSSSWATRITPLNKVTAQNTAPTTPVCGAIWFDTANNQVKKYDCETTTWITVHTITI
jgi:hypothetical protein